MLLMSVCGVVFTMVPDVTNNALPYCECGLSITKSSPLHAHDSTVESWSKISYELLLFRC